MRGFDSLRRSRYGDLCRLMVGLGRLGFESPQEYKNVFLGNQKQIFAFISIKRNSMKVIKLPVEGRDLFLPMSHSNEISKDGKTFHFFYEGWKKVSVKKCEIVAELPDGEISWLEVAKATDQYGLEVGEYYANKKVAGFRARRVANGFTYIYRKVKHLIDASFKSEFFDLLECDGKMLCLGIPIIDIFELDKKLGVDINESMEDHLVANYGQVYADIVRAAL